MLKAISIEYDIINEGDKENFKFESWVMMILFFSEKSGRLGALENHLTFKSPEENQPDIDF